MNQSSSGGHITKRKPVESQASPRPLTKETENANEILKENTYATHTEPYMGIDEFFKYVGDERRVYSGELSIEPDRESQRFGNRVLSTDNEHERKSPKQGLGYRSLSTDNEHERKSPKQGLGYRSLSTDNEHKRESPKQGLGYRSLSTNNEHKRESPKQRLGYRSLSTDNEHERESPNQGLGYRSLSTGTETESGNNLIKNELGGQKRKFGYRSLSTDIETEPVDPNDRLNIIRQLKYRKLHEMRRQADLDIPEHTIFIHRQQEHFDISRNYSTTQYVDTDFERPSVIAKHKPKDSPDRHVYTYKPDTLNYQKRDRLVTKDHNILSIKHDRDSIKRDRVSIKHDRVSKEDHPSIKHDRESIKRDWVSIKHDRVSKEDHSLDEEDDLVDVVNDSVKSFDETNDDDDSKNFDSENSWQSDVYPQSEENSYQRTAAESLISLKMSMSAKGEEGEDQDLTPNRDYHQNTESASEGSGKKRGGGKMGRRRKRGYIYDPKPLISKTKTNSLPLDLKDKEYWDRRQRNNEAAKRSREHRRVKELETVDLVKRLTESNQNLRKKIYELELRNKYLEEIIGLSKSKQDNVEEDKPSDL